MRTCTLNVNKVQESIKKHQNRACLYRGRHPRTPLLRSLLNAGSPKILQTPNILCSSLSVCLSVCMNVVLFVLTITLQCLILCRLAMSCYSSHLCLRFVPCTIILFGRGGLRPLVGADIILLHSDKSMINSHGGRGRNNKMVETYRQQRKLSHPRAFANQTLMIPDTKCTSLI